MRRLRFQNSDPVQTAKTMAQFKRWRQERQRKVKHKDYSYVVPNTAPDLTYIDHNGTEPSVTWIGHSTFLIQHSGLNIVTDPVWAAKMAMNKRMAPPGIEITDMPPIDIVLVSHSHYDHLNIASLRRLTGSKLLLVPAGLRAKLRLKGFMRVKEFHWWESITVRGVRFTFVPSQHSTRRTPWDMNKSHWGGWIIEPDPEAAKSARKDKRQQAAISALAVLKSEQIEAAPSDSPQRPIVGDKPVLYFAGDSGYFRGFEEIGRRFAIDVTLMPIGAYEPEWFMAPQHVSPEEALQAFLDTGARWFVPMHYSCFKLADDTPREALDRLEKGRCQLNIDEERLVLLSHGETWRLSGR